MSIAYLIMMLGQPFGFATITGLVFPYKKRRDVAYVYFIHLAYIMWVEYIRLNAPDKIYGYFYLVFNLIEILLPLLFAKFFHRSALWKTTFCYLAMGVLNNQVNQMIIMACFKNSKISACRNIYVAFINYLNRNVNRMTLRGAIYYFVYSVAIFLIMALIYRRMTTKERENSEKIYRLIYSMIAIVLVGSNVALRTAREYMGQSTFVFWEIIVPLAEVMAVTGLIIVFAIQEKKTVSIKYRNIQRHMKEERGDSNKNFEVFANENVNTYINFNINTMKNSGIAVDVISYMGDRISLPVEDDSMISELDKIFTWISNNISEEMAYMVMGIKREKNALVIHFEYNHRKRLKFLSQLIKSEYMYISDDYYRLEQHELMRDEIMLYYPECFGDEMP